MKFAFPILTAKGEEFKDAKALTALINGEKSGHYLLGNHNKWHGGIHISDKSAPWCKDTYPVRAIADGKVVAFRMIEDYLTSEFQGESLRYSNCFCLVQHEYCEINAETKAKNEFTFYSLYMHLLPWSQYQTAEKLVLKKSWNARNSAPHANPDEDQKRADAALPRFALPKDTELEIDSGTPPQKGMVGGKEYDFIKVTIKSPLSSTQTTEGEKAGVLVSEGSSVWIANSPDAVTFIKPNLPSWLFDQIDAELLTNMAGRADPTPDNETGRLMAGSGSVSLPAGTKVQYDAHQLEFHWVGDKARKMARCKYVMPSVDGVPGSCGLAWVCVEDEYIKVNARAPSHLGELYVLSSPVAIAAGETIGYLGLVETPGSLIGGRKSKHQVHLEVFTQDPRLDDVLSNKANTKGGATYAKVPADLVLHEKKKQDGKDLWVATDSKSLEELVESPKLEKDAANQEWVSVSSGKYVKKERIALLSQHDWLQIGFKKIDGSGSDGYLDPDAPPAFFTNLVKSFDTDGNGELSSEELQAALQNSGNADQLHKLIVKHPSEWYEKSSASSYLWLDKLMAKIGLPDFDQLVDHEKQRIDKLEWMQSAAKLRFSKDIWHFYPLHFNFKSSRTTTGVNWARSVFGNYLASVESGGDYSAYNNIARGKVSSFYKTNLTSMSINEVMAAQSQPERKMFAVGRYQLIPSTLISAINHLKIDRSSLFNEEVQDYLFNRYLIAIKRPEIINFLEKNGDVEDAIYSWAKEFASAGVRKGRVISKNRVALGGESYYAGDGLNKAHITPDKMVNVLVKAKEDASK